MIPRHGFESISLGNDKEQLSLLINAQENLENREKSEIGISEKNVKIEKR